MSNKTTFVAENFTGMLVENFEIVPSADGTMLGGLGFVASDGATVRVVVPYNLLELLPGIVEQAVARCMDRQETTYGDTAPGRVRLGIVPRPDDT